jgi:uncharacterized BrkB/YihY/UPF0761 family membrane protein
MFLLNFLEVFRVAVLGVLPVSGELVAAKYSLDCIRFMLQQMRRNLIVFFLCYSTLIFITLYYFLNFSDGRKKRYET